MLGVEVLGGGIAVVGAVVGVKVGGVDLVGAGVIATDFYFSSFVSETFTIRMA